jgi:hypothetical protein
MFKEENAQQAVDKSVDLEEYTGQMGTHWASVQRQG